MKVAIATITKVPIIALPKPPPGLIAAGGRSVNAVSVSPAIPFFTSRKSTEKSGSSAAIVAAPVSMLIA